jgi:hypothetical protein
MISSLVDEYKFKKSLNVIGNVFIKIRSNYLYLEDNKYKLVKDPIFRMYIDSHEYIIDPRICNSEMKNSLNYKNVFLVSYLQEIDFGLINEITEERILYWHDL